MQVKFEKHLNDYDYIFAFDIAKVTSGYALVDFKNRKILIQGLIVTEKNSPMPWEDLYNQIDAVVTSVRSTYGDNFFVIKERVPNQAGPRSSIDALQGLAKAHAIFDLYVAQHKLDYYDYNGIHSISVKAFFKNKYGIDKPQKIDILHCLQQEYAELVGKGETKSKDWALDISDAIALVDTLIEKKWNADIDEEARLERKHMRELEREKDIKIHQDRIDFIYGLKV